MKDNKTYVALIVFVLLGLFLCLIGITMIGIGVYVLSESNIIVRGESKDFILVVEDVDYNYDNFNNKLYTTYKDFENDYGTTSLTPSDFNKNNMYTLLLYHHTCEENGAYFSGYTLDNGVLKVEGVHKDTCGVCKPTYDIYVVKLDRNVKEINRVKYDINNVKATGCNMYTEDKPMIYIYPTEDMHVSVRLGNKDLITTSYPKYIDGWDVYAKKDGNLEYNGRNYYGLYWEGIKTDEFTIRDGFVVKGEDTVKFLEEKLEILGLNEREINEFIIYWLPKMEHNKYNYIRFETREEIDNYMPLEVTPVPDTTIRVYMNFKALDEEIEVEEQKLEKVTRSGYSVIEWGGSIIE